MGENHRDETVSDELVKPLLEADDFSNLYLEALTQGSYQEQGEDLKQTEPPHSLVMLGKLPYDHNPDKYDSLIEKALEEGIDVYGLTTPAGPTDSVGHWAEYIRETEGNSNLILTGKSHVDRWESGEVRRVSPERERRHPPLDFMSEINLPANLVSLGTASAEISTVSTHFTEEDNGSKLVERSQFPGSLAATREYQTTDYLLIADQSVPANQD